MAASTVTRSIRFILLLWAYDYDGVPAIPGDRGCFRTVSGSTFPYTQFSLVGADDSCAVGRICLRQETLKKNYRMRWVWEDWLLAAR